MTSRLAVGTICLAAVAAMGFQAPRASPRPVPPPVFEGTVKGPDGKPVEGALVIASEVATGRDSPLTTRTDTSGRFCIQARRPQPHNIRVQARGLAVTLLERVSPAAALTVTLRKGAAIEGTVRDAEGRPVAGARVVASSLAGFVFLPWEPEAGTVSAVSDLKGRYRLEGLPPGPQAVTATAPGFGRARKANARPGTVVDLTMTPGAWISGTVVGPDGKPVEGAMVRAEAAMGRGGAVLTEVTDQAGRFVLAGLDPYEYTVIARAKDLGPGLVAGLRVEREAETRTEIVLSRGASITGRLVDAEERPVTGRIQLQDLEGRPAPYSLVEGLKTEAGPDGRFVLERVPQGALSLAVLGRGHAPKRVEVEVRPRDTSVQLGDVVLELGLAISGRVRAKSGAAIAEAYLSGYFRRPSGGMTHPPETRSEADGSFTLAGLEPGTYELMVSAPDFAQARRTLEAGAEGVDIVLSPGGTITGTVVDSADRPVESFAARAEGIGPERVFGPGGRGTDGRLVIHDVAEGTYVVKVEAPELTPGTVSGVKVVAGQTTDVGKVRLTRGAVVRGVVVDRSGGPVVGARIVVRSALQQFRMSSLLSAESDVNGAFEVKGAPEGKVDISAVHPGYAPGRVGGVDVDPAKDPPEVRVVLTAGGRIEGWARKRDGTPLSGTQVHLRPLDPDRRYDGGTAPVTPLPDGSFVVEHVMPGRTSVTLMAVGSGMATSMQSRDVDVVEGQTTTVDFSVREVLVSGRVSRAGAPLSGVRVNLRTRSMSSSFWGGPARAPAGESGPQRMTAITAEDGSYELVANDSGRATVAVESLDGKTQFPTREVEIPDADTFAFDLTFAGVTVSGLVVDKETGQGLAEGYVWAAPSGKSGRGGGGFSAPDGRFTLELEPGSYKVRASARAYTPATLEVTADAGAGPDLRFELTRGLTIRGKVLDGAGRPLPGMMVMASGAESSPWSGSAPTFPDGSFLLEGLAAQPHTLVTGSGVAGFAIRTGVTPGGSEVTLRLRPGGRIRAMVVNQDGAPVSGAYGRITKVDGASVRLYSMGPPETTAQGVQEIDCPAGFVELEAAKEKLRGTGTANVSPGAITEVRIVVSERPSGN